MAKLLAKFEKQPKTAQNVAKRLVYIAEHSRSASKVKWAVKSINKVLGKDIDRVEDTAYRVANLVRPYSTFRMPFERQ